MTEGQDMPQDMGATPTGSGRSPKGGAASSTASPAKPSAPSAALAAMVEQIEAAGDLGWEGIERLNEAIHEYQSDPKAIQPPDYLRSFDAALALLPEGSDWRRFTPMSVSFYAASPYNAAAQVRHDGYGPTPAAQLCAARFKALLAKAKQMEPRP